MCELYCIPRYTISDEIIPSFTFNPLLMSIVLGMSIGLGMKIVLGMIYKHRFKHSYRHKYLSDKAQFANIKFGQTNCVTRVVRQQ